MIPQFIYYPKCSTCIKAAKWLKENRIEVEARDIVMQNPTATELTHWISTSGKTAAKFFNTSGLRYKALNLKETVKTASTNELTSILASEGMLVKRPILVCDHGVLVGFKPEEWAMALLRH